VVVQTGATTSVVGIVLPDGTFCVDVPLSTARANTLKVWAVGNGKTSAPVVLNVVQTATAPVPANATCSNTSATPDGGAGCSGPNAACSLACNGCPEDVYQPNSTPSQAPAIALRANYPALQLCPCVPDWFTFVLYKGQHINVQAIYQKTKDFDLDIALYQGGDVLPTLSGKPPVASSTAGTNGSAATRTIDFVAATGAAYYLEVAATTGAASHGAYSLVTQSQ
jgi:hypothetical protein